MIRLENLSINIENNKLLIGNINIFIPSGFLVSITGEPASGKTRLFKVLGLQEKADVGNLYILGKNINKLNRYEIAKLHNEISLVNENSDLIYISRAAVPQSKNANCDLIFKFLFHGFKI